MFKIIAEQACRFRTQSGYRICAKSKDFTDTNAQHMEDEFNDSMNPLFNGSIGKSCLSCVTTGEDTFLALCTLRTDVHGRPAIFTNAAVVPTAVYRQKIAEDPAGIIFTPLDQLTNHMPAAPLLPGIEMGGVEAPDLAALRLKYDLTDERYAALLCGAYRALTSMKCLCLRTSKAVDEIQTVRELCYCIAMGAPASMRGQISYSSAGDLRKNICLSTPRNGMVSGDEITFELDAGAPVEELSPLDQIMYLHLARLPEAERAMLLARMDDWLNALLGDRSEYPADFAVMAFYYINFAALEAKPELARKLVFLALDAAKGTPCNANVLEQALVSLLRLLPALPTESREALLARMSVTDNEEFRQAVLNLLSECGQEEQARMLEQALNGGFGAQSSEIAAMLMDKIPADSTVLTQELQERVIRAVLSGAFAGKEGYAQQLVDHQPMAARTQLADSILCSFAAENGGLRQPRREEWQMLLHIFETQIREAFAGGDKAGYHRLNTDPTLALSEKARGVWQTLGNTEQDLRPLQPGMVYVLLTHYAAQNMRDSVGEINALKQTAPLYQNALLQTAREMLPEYYEALCLLYKVMKAGTVEELVKVFSKPNALFAQLPRQLEEEIVAKFAGLYSKRPHRTGADWIIQALDEEGEMLQKTCLPETVQNRICTRELNWSLNQISYHDLLSTCGERKGSMERIWNVVRELDDSSIKANPKVKFIKAYYNMILQQQDAAFVKLVLGKELGLSPEERGELSQKIPRMMEQIAMRHHPFSWELFFLYCCTDDGCAWDEDNICEMMEEVSAARLMNPEELYSRCPEWVTPEDCRTLYKCLKEGAGHLSSTEKEMLRVLKDLSRGKKDVPAAQPLYSPERFETPHQEPMTHSSAQSTGLRKPASYEEETTEDFDVRLEMPQSENESIAWARSSQIPTKKPEPKKKGGFFNKLFDKKDRG